MVKILVIGDAITDHYIYGTISRMSPESRNVPVLDVSNVDFRLGGCLNVAANIKSLSENAVCVSSIITTRLRHMLKSRGILYKYAYTPNTDQEGLIKTRVIGDKLSKQIIRIDNALKFSDDLLEEFMCIFDCIDLSEFDFIVVSDYCKGIVSDLIISRLKAYLGLVFVDTKNPNLTIWDNIPNCIIKINEIEWEKSQQNRTQRSCHKVIVTQGSDGAEIHNTQDWNDIVEVETEAILDSNIDVTGCGDVFLSGLVCKFIETKDIYKSVQFANMVAGRSVLTQGTTEVLL